MKNTIYEKNTESLTKHQSSLVEILNHVNIEDENKFRVIEGKRGHKVLQARRVDGTYINYNSIYDPYKEATQITSSLDYSINRSMIVVVGVGLGYHINEIIDKLNSKSLILAIEKNKSVLKILLSHVDFSEYIKKEKIFFLTGEFEEDNLKDQLSEWIGRLYPNTLSIQPQVLPISDIEYIKFSKKVFRSIFEIKEKYKFALGNDVDDTLLGVHNRLTNLSHIIRNPGINDFIKRYGDVYKGKPAIIIASGPSLDKNIHLLKEAQGKALLLACDGSMSALKKHGIVPDVVSSVERIMLTYEAFYKDVHMPDETVLVAPAVVRPEIFNSFNTRTLSNFKYEGIAAWFNTMAGDKGLVWSGTSVAHHLFGLATLLGTDPIILVGQDLAYSPKGVSHVNEASVKETIDINKVELYVKDIYGGDIATTFVWKQFKEIYENAISQSKAICIDATEGGALIRGTTIMTLREAIANYCNEPVYNFRSLVDSLPIEEDYIRTTHLHALRGIRKLTKKFHLLQKRADKNKGLNIIACQLIEKGIKTEEELNRIYTAIEYTDNKIIKYLRKDPGLYMFFQYHIMLTVFKVNQLGTEVTIDVLHKNLEIQYELLEIISRYSKKMISVLKEGFDDLKLKSEDILDNKVLEEYIFPKF